MNASAQSERLNRYLARRGVSSRRGADLLIEAGRVTVNGSRAGLGTQVSAGRDAVRVDGRAVGGATRVLTMRLNKPAGVVTTAKDPQGRPTVISLIRPTPGLVPVGRLDADSRGLLLLTTDGELAHRVAHPRHGITKRYRVTVREQVSVAHLRALTKETVLEDGPAHALKAGRRGPNGIDVVIAEGRKREVRRLCAAAGLTVVDLLRTDVGPVTLGHLPEGAARPLTEAQLASLYRAVDLPPPVA